MTLLELIRKTPAEAGDLDASVDCQVMQLKSNATKNGKPYFEVEVADGTAGEKFKVWQDSPAYADCEDMQSGDFVRLTGRFRRNQYGLNVDHPELRILEDREIASLLAGSPEHQTALQRDFDFISETVGRIVDPRLRLLAQTFLKEYGDRFRRAAAARDYHHARRGGLLEHTAQMMRAAEALRVAYPSVHWDLVACGVLFHDCGKMWENDYEADGFVSPISTVGELLGHITIGIELVNRLWRSLDDQPEFKEAGAPAREQVREHLLHLIASHHGEKEYGAPVTPRTPEGWMLHYIDNIDARYEMLQLTYLEKAQVGPGIFDYRRPLEGRAVQPLPSWKPGKPEPAKNSAKTKY